MLFCSIFSFQENSAKRARKRHLMDQKTRITHKRPSDAVSASSVSHDSTGKHHYVMEHLLRHVTHTQKDQPLLQSSFPSFPSLTNFFWLLLPSPSASISSILTSLCIWKSGKKGLEREIQQQKTDDCMSCSRRLMRERRRRWGLGTRIVSSCSSLSFLVIIIPFFFSD